MCIQITRVSFCIEKENVSRSLQALNVCVRESDCVFVHERSVDQPGGGNAHCDNATQVKGREGNAAGLDIRLRRLRSAATHLTAVFVSEHTSTRTSDRHRRI